MGVGGDCVTSQRASEREAIIEGRHFIQLVCEEIVQSNMPVAMAIFKRVSHHPSPY